MSKYSGVLKTCEYLMEQNKHIETKLAEKMRRLAAKRAGEYKRCQRILRYIDKTE